MAAPRVRRWLVLRTGNATSSLLDEHPDDPSGERRTRHISKNEQNGFEWMSDGYINWDGRDDKNSSVSVQNNNDSVVLTLLEVWRFFKCIYLAAVHVRILECLCHM